MISWRHALIEIRGLSCESIDASNSLAVFLVVVDKNSARRCTLLFMGSSIECNFKLTETYLSRLGGGGVTCVSTCASAGPATTNYQEGHV